jgi:hypothetical protein
LSRLLSRLSRRPEAARFAKLRAWHFAGADEMAERLRAAGFVEVETWLEATEAPLGDRATFREFVRRIILREHLPLLDDESARERLLDALADEAAADDPPFVLDYCRLNLSGRRSR